MAEPMKTAPGDSSAASPEVQVPEDGFNRRIGLALFISIGANVLLLQGAGVMAKNMTIAPHDENGTINMVITHQIVKATPEPTPTPEPTAKPTPAVRKHEKVTPTPRPPKATPTPAPRPTPERVIPTPKPSVAVVPTPPPAKPTPEPIRDRARPTPPPVDVKPDVVTPPIPQPNVAATRPVPTAAQSVSSATIKTESAAAAAMTPRTATLRTNNRAALGSNSSPKLLGMPTRPNSDAAPSNFHISNNSNAPTPVVRDLPARTMAGAFAAALSATNVRTIINNAPDVQTTMDTRTTSQLKTVGGRLITNTGRVNVMTRRSDIAPAQPTFTAAAGGAISPGTHSAFQGNMASSTVQAISSSSATTIKNNSGYQASVSAPNLAVGTNPGVFRKGKLMSNRVEQLTSDRNTSAPGGGSITNAFGTAANAGGNTNGPQRGTISHGTATAAYSVSGSNNPNLRTGGGIAVAGTNDSHQVGAGSLSTGGRRTGPRGSQTGSLGGTRDGVEGGTPGLSNGDVHGGGNGASFHTGSAAGVVGGIGSGHGVGFKTGGGNLEARGGGDKQNVGGPAHVESQSEVGDRVVGAPREVDYVHPSNNPPVPESLRATAYNTTANVMVTFLTSGQVRVKLTKSSGYPALDAEVVAVCERIKVRHPAVQDGSPVQTTHEITFTLINKG